MKATFALAAAAALVLGASATPLKTRFNPGKKGSNFVDASAIAPLAGACVFLVRIVPIAS
jgi:hypothetical protein